MIETMRVDQPQTPMITTDNDCNDWHDCHNCHDKRIEMIPFDNNERVDDMASTNLENKKTKKLDVFLEYDYSGNGNKLDIWNPEIPKHLPNVQLNSKYLRPISKWRCSLRSQHLRKSPQMRQKNSVARCARNWRLEMSSLFQKSSNPKMPNIWKMSSLFLSSLLLIPLYRSIKFVFKLGANFSALKYCAKTKKQFSL